MTVVDDSSEQLQQDLLQSVQDALSASRPILTHLNADTTWLLQVPYPEDAQRPFGRTRFNILIDPWLQGTQSDVASWFSSQWHAIKSSVQHISELEAYLLEIEHLAEQATSYREGINNVTTASSLIDAVIVSHEFTDHCHKATLLELPSSVPVFATTKAASLIRSWKHFSTVNDIPVFDGADWHRSSISPLPSWLGISRIITPSLNPLYFHAAVGIFIASSASPLADAEAVIYTPHGIQASSVESVAKAKPPIRTLALLHGLDEISIGSAAQLNLGAHNALKAQRVLGAKYWIGTHEEDKGKSGLVAPFLRRKQVSLEEALKEEAGENLDDVEFFNLRSGESRLLL